MFQTVIKPILDERMNNSKNNDYQYVVIRLHQNHGAYRNQTVHYFENNDYELFYECLYRSGGVFLQFKMLDYHMKVR